MADDASSYLSSSLVILFGSIIGAIMSESLFWLLVTRQEDYQRLCAQLTRIGTQLQKRKDGNESKDKNNDKNVKRMESEVRVAFAKIARRTTRTGVFTFVGSYFIVYYFLSTFYSGVVVAKLPFGMPSWTQWVSLYGLESEDATDCSLLFLLVTSGFAFRNIARKIFGNESPMILGIPTLMGNPIPPSMQKYLDVADYAQ